MHDSRRVGIWAACFIAFLPGVLAAATPAERAAKSGELVERKHHRVLRLFGEDPRERGYAHGYLLAEEIIASVDDALNTLPWVTVDKFNGQLTPWALEKFYWSEDVKAELTGVYEGLRARLGDQARSKVLDRALTMDDLYAINCIADWFGPACSGFTAWGENTPNGEVLYGRNLDFPIGGKAVTNQVIIAAEALPARDGRPARAAWMGVGWPGLIGIYSAMNEHGFIVCLHDAENVRKEGAAKKGFINRGLLLRAMIERIDPGEGDPVDAAVKMAAERPAACGNLFHLNWTSADAKKLGGTPAAVLEFDAAGRGSGETPVQARRMDDTHLLVLSNHYCVRAAAVPCRRFTAIENGLKRLTEGDRKLNIDDARRILISAELLAAAHTLVFQPDRMTVHVALSRGNVLSPRVVPQAFTFEELFRKKAGE